MSLNVYGYDDFTNRYSAYSTGGTKTDPGLCVVDSKEATISEQKMFVRNDDSEVYYTGVTLSWLPTTTVVNNVHGLVFKILYQSNQPTEAEWSAVNSGNTDTVGSIGSSSTADQSYLPFWIRIEIPRNTPVGVYDTPYIYVYYTAEVEV